ncbi:transposase-like protein [Pedobacter sp. UYP24]
MAPFFFRYIHPAKLNGSTYKSHMHFVGRIALSCKSWLDNWVNFSAFFEYDYVIRKIIYTTNPIEGVRQIRKITKTKGAFSSEQA